jgi:DnaJ-class molecular chaperone
MARGCRRRRSQQQDRRERRKTPSSLVGLAAAAAAVAASKPAYVEVAATSSAPFAASGIFLGASRRASDRSDLRLLGGVHCQTPGETRRAPSSAFRASCALRGGDDSDDNAERHGGSSSSHDTEKAPDKSQQSKPRRRRSSKGRQHNKGENLSSDAARPSKSGAASASSKEQTGDGSDKASSPSSSSPSSRVVQEILRSDDYYEILGLTREQVRDSADPLHAVTKAYRRRCVHTHPDKTGGDRAAFDKVAEAYHVLSDETQRTIYDRHGKRGLQQHQQSGGGGMGGGFGGGQGMSAEDLFRSFFEGSMGGGGGGGGFFRSSQQQQPPVRRNRTTRYQLEVTLPDLYKGMSRTIRIAPPQPSPFFQQRQRPHADAESLSKSVDVRVPRGTLEGADIVLSGEIDFARDAPPADLVLVVKQVPHPVFQRKNYDLITTVRLPLSEALCGFSSLSIPHLSGEDLVVSYGDDESGDVSTDFRPIRSGDVHVLKGHGMPKDESGRKYGDLYVVYQVEMPSASSEARRSRKASPLEGRGSLSKEERRELKRLLSKLEGKDEPDAGVGSTTGSTCSTVLGLQRASASDIGRASGQPPPPPASSEPHLEDEQQEQHGPFGSQFFFSSSNAPGAGSGPSFFGMPGFDPPDDGVQCRQM